VKEIVSQMPRNLKNARKEDRQSQDQSKELWIAPRYSLKGPKGERAWENRAGGPSSNSRFLELADIADGNKETWRSQEKNFCFLRP
jgi:hypothetical protein